MKVRYQWSEDGVAETCDIKKVVATADCYCCHCDSKIKAGDTVALMTAYDGSHYLLHIECAKDGIM